MRRMMGYPPFSAFFSILLTGENRAETEAAAERLATLLAQKDDEGLFSVLGPAPAVPARLRGEYRFRIIIKGETAQPLREFILPHIEEVRREWKNSVRLQLALNQTSFS